ncbi:hypothetical protein M0657_009615 [Pyricularia oryzae]|nr:hypothetical protein M0657_009615 [Pyricularia oryzae]KAI7914282.1 hypothetical protein M9X92_009068 [Pyricularia oryzae]
MRTLHVGKGGLIDGPDALSFETIHATANACLFRPATLVNSPQRLLWLRLALTPTTSFSFSHPPSHWRRQALDALHVQTHGLLLIGSAPQPRSSAKMAKVDSR